jgi:chromosome segregation ATPase
MLTNPYFDKIRYSELVNTTKEKDSSLETLTTKLSDSEHAQKRKENEIAMLKEEAGASLQGKESLAQRLQGEVQKRDDEIKALQELIGDLKAVSYALSFSFFIFRSRFSFFTLFFHS